MPRLWKCACANCAGRRDDALKLYRAALATIRQADAAAARSAAKAGAPARATGMLITARRGTPGAPSATLSYATPAAGLESREVGAGATAAASHAVADVADDWLRRAREFEAGGRRKEALQAYRQAAIALRGGNGPPLYSPIPP